MTLDQIEELIRKYLAMGVTVVIILTSGPNTGGASGPGASGTSAPPSVVTIDPRAPSSDRSATGTATAAPSTTPTGSSDTTGASGTDPGSADTTPGTDSAYASSASGDAGSAAAKFGWGKPDRTDDFTSGTGQWRLYDGAGHDGKGTRSPAAAKVADGVLTITGSPDGTTAGMAWNPGQKYGRWEARVRTPAGDPSYHAVMLLWPDAENWPAGGEVDFMEISDATRQSTEMFLHYGEDNSQKSGKVEIDATQWHDWAVEWTPKGITAFVDGQEWWKTTDTSILPPGPMHMTIQLDWFPEGGTVKESSMSVDWVRQYPVSGG